MFNLIQIDNGNGIRVEYATNGLLAFELHGANALAIAMIYANLTRQSPQRADDYLSGVLAGLVFCQVSQSFPAVTLK
jgi:hypothetical protein